MIQHEVTLKQSQVKSFNTWLSRYKRIILHSNSFILHQLQLKFYLIPIQLDVVQIYYALFSVRAHKISYFLEYFFY